MIQKVYQIQFLKKSDVMYIIMRLPKLLLRVRKKELKKKA